MIAYDIFLDGRWSKTVVKGTASSCFIRERLPLSDWTGTFTSLFGTIDSDLICNSNSLIKKNNTQLEIDYIQTKLVVQPHWSR